MQLNEVGFVFHKNLGAVEIDRSCVALQAQNPDSSTAFVKHEGEIKEVTRALLVSVDSVDAIAEEMKELRWQRVEPPIWWEDIGDFIIADGGLGTLRPECGRHQSQAGEECVERALDAATANAQQGRQQRGQRQLARSGEGLGVIGTAGGLGKVRAVQVIGIIGQNDLIKTTVLRRGSCQRQRKINQNQHLTDLSSLSSVDWVAP